MSPTPEARRERRKRDRLVILCAACALGCLIATVVVGFTTLNNNSQLADQRAGRAAALDISCATNKAIIEAGRTIILGGTLKAPPRAQERALVRLGFPPYPIRRAQARAAARAYAAKIAQTVEDQSGVRGLVNPDGTLNCDRYKRAAKAR